MTSGQIYVITDIYIYIEGLILLTVLLLYFQTGEMEVKNPLFSDETPVTPTPTTDKRLEN